MQAASLRKSVDLSGYPDLVVIYLGMRVKAWRGIKSVMGIGRGLGDLVRHKPDGLLAHETLMFGVNHIGMRQYWRDMDSLERFTRADPHKTWWRDFMRDTGGTGFWHETYARKGGMEAIYIAMPAPIGFGRFAPDRAPDGPFVSARERLATDKR